MHTRASGITLYQGGPGSKFSKAPRRSAKGTSRAPYMHEFSRESRACSPGKFLNLESPLKCHFLDFGERFYRILMVRKRHCNKSEALANVFALSPKPGAPGFSRSEPIVVTPLTRATKFVKGNLLTVHTRRGKLVNENLLPCMRGLKP